MYALVEKLEVSVDVFVGRGTELGSIVVGNAGPRGVVARFDGPQPSLFDGESRGYMEILEKGFDSG